MPATPHYSTRALAALARGIPADPESYDLGLPPCDHADTVRASCPACDGAGYHLSGHASPTCVVETRCEDCGGEGVTGRRLCLGCDCEVGS